MNRIGHGGRDQEGDRARDRACVVHRPRRLLEVAYQSVINRRGRLVQHGKQERQNQDECK